MPRWGTSGQAPAGFRAMLMRRRGVSPRAPLPVKRVEDWVGAPATPGSLTPT